MSLVKSLAKWSAPSNEVNSGKSDLLLRYLQSTVIDAWVLLQHLYNNTQPGVHDYLCNRIYELGEEAIEKYLLQFVYLAVSKPGQALERTIVDLCSKSFRVAIKTQWLLVALCQDHPRSRALESFRERAYKAALEGKWEVPIRNPKLDPLSPLNSQLLSPPFSPPFSPGSSLVLSHMPPNQRLNDPPLPQPPNSHKRCPFEAEAMADFVVTQPPDSIVMSPPAGAGGLVGGAAQPPAASAVVTGMEAPSDTSSLRHRGSAGLHIDLGCLLPPEPRNLQGAGLGGAALAAAPAAPAPTAGEVAADGNAIALADETSPSPGIPLPNGNSPDGSAAALSSCTHPPVALQGSRGGPAVTAGGGSLNDVAAAVYGSVPAVCVTARHNHPGPGAPNALPAPMAPAGAVPGGPHSSNASTTTTAVIVGGTAAGRPGLAGGGGGTYGVISAAAANLAERIQSLKRELGEGEGVSALLERSKQQGVGLVVEEESVFSDDEFGNRPMSPLTRLRYDTFGATLDFVDALCDASSALTSYSQEERHRALRLGLEHINREIEAANRRDVAIWFPMGRGGDRVLRLTAREAVLLNSREKAPFLLYVEVLEGQQECGEGHQPSLGPDALTATAAAAAAAGEGFGTTTSCVGGGDGASSLSGGKPLPAPVVEFGRRETYGIALTGIGAQHQQQYMHSSPGVTSRSGPGPGPGHSSGQRDAVHPPEQPVSQVGSTASTNGRSSLPSHCAPTIDTSSTIADTPGGLSPCMSTSSQQLRSVADSPSGHTVLLPAVQQGGHQGPGLPPPQQQQQQHGAGAVAVAAVPLAAPIPVHACTPAHAAALEDQAAKRASEPAATAAAAVQSLSATLPPAQAQAQAAPPAVVIPTRSASSSNIAAAAIAATTAATSGLLSAEGGGGGNQSQPMTPRTASQLSFAAAAGGLPPRPPLPLGSISPINAAKEVSPQLAAQSGGGMLGASSLLRRVMGTEEAVLVGPSGGGGGGGAVARIAVGVGGNGGGKSARDGSIGSVVRSLCFSNPEAVVGSPEPMRSDSIASAAMAAAAANRPPLTGITMQPQGMTATPAGPGVRAPLALPPRPSGGELTEEEMQELLASGCLSPPASIKSDPDMATKLSALMASYRGEAPLVRVRIRVLPPQQQLPQHQRQTPPSATSGGAGAAGVPPPAPGLTAPAQDAPAPAAAAAAAAGPLCEGGSSADSAGQSLPGASFSLASLGLGGLGRGRGLLGEDGGAASAVTAAATAAAAGDGGPTEKSKALALLSRLGLCRKPPSDEGDDVAAQAGTAASAVASAGGTAPAAAAGGGTTAPGVAGAAAMATRRLSMRPWGVVPRLVQVTFEVGQGLDLTIPSPYRKSRRTPSHEAIEMLAGKYKVLHMPPPYQCGPPLGPMSYSPSGSTTFSVRERPSEEGEGATASATAAAGTTNSTAPTGAVVTELSFASGRRPPYLAPESTDLASTAAATASAPESTSSSDERTAAERAMVRHSGSDGGAATGADAGVEFSLTGAGTKSTLRPGGPLPPTPILHHRMRRPPSPAAVGGSAAAAAVAAPPASGSSGLAASFQRILSRAAGQPTPSDTPSSQPAAGPGKGPSPRGGSSPVRSGSSVGSHGSAAASAAAGPGGPPAASSDAGGGPGAAAAASSIPISSTGSRLSRLIGSGLSSGGSSAFTANSIPLEASTSGIAVPLPTTLSKAGSRAATAAASGLAAAASAAAVSALPYSGAVKVTDGRQERESLGEQRRREANAVYGERWAAKVKRIQKESPHGCREGWALRCVIVKSGDDCRQELLALQLVRTFGEIFREAGLPLWVRHYEILVTSNKTALIEMVPNTLSIHTIKSRSPPGTSLSDHFFAKFGRAGTSGCTAAQRHFTESLAAYSLICYLLQIKDRHNGNILIDDDGRIVHIDFGFLLSNSPGGVNFESAPFKLTRELLEVMDSNSDGKPSEMFDYFKVLMIQGFLAVRKHGDRILLLVRMMSKSGFPCFKGGERAVKALEKRLQLSLSEVQCVAHVLQLIAESLDAWRTRQYDYYQRVLNGIL